MSKTEPKKIVAHDYVVEDELKRKPATEQLIHSKFAKTSLIAGLFVLGVAIGIALGRGPLKPEPTVEEATQKLFGEEINVLSS